VTPHAPVVRDCTVDPWLLASGFVLENDEESTSFAKCIYRAIALSSGQDVDEEEATTAAPPALRIEEISTEGVSASAMEDIGSNTFI